MKLPAASCRESKRNPPSLLRVSAYVNSAHDIKPNSTTTTEQDGEASCTATHAAFPFSAVALPLKIEATENGKATRELIVLR